MKQGKARFQYQLSIIEKLLLEAQSHENSALWLYLHDLRTPLFMLEGLSKLYAQLHDEKIFIKLRDTVKVIEDMIGAVDYYVSFSKDFEKNEQISDELRNHLDKKSREKIDLLNKSLIQDGWLDGKMLKEITKKLGKIEWLNEEAEVKKIRKFYLGQIKKIKEFVAETTFDFDNIEDDVHELRRKLRWLSIYPQALRGLIQLQEKLPVEESLNQYLTAEIITSPFNILPINNDLENYVFLEKNSFYALSWIIAELGKIKDKGLKISILKDAIQEIHFINDEKSYVESYKILGSEYPKMQSLLSEASQIIEQFFKRKILDSLVFHKSDNSS